MTLKDYAPELPVFWIDQARGRFPGLGWAIDELPMASTLDDVCVELESIAGLRAFQTRQVILTGMQADILKMFERYDTEIEKSRKLLSILAEGSTRLCIWLQLQCVRDPRAGITQKEYLKALDAIDAWCAGRMTAGEIERMNRWLARDVVAEDVRQAELVAWLYSDVYDTRNAYFRRPAFIANEAMYILAELQANEYLEDESNGIYEVMLEAIPRFPVFDPTL